MIQLLGPVVGPSYTVLPSRVDNKSTVSWVNKLYAKLDVNNGNQYVQRLDWLLQYTHYFSHNNIHAPTSYIETAQNILPDSLTRVSKYYLFEQECARVRAAGKIVTRIPVPIDWYPGIFNT